MTSSKLIQHPFNLSKCAFIQIHCIEEFTDQYWVNTIVNQEDHHFEPFSIVPVFFVHKPATLIWPVHNGSNQVYVRFYPFNALLVVCKLLLSEHIFFQETMRSEPVDVVSTAAEPPILLTTSTAHGSPCVNLAHPVGTQATGLKRKPLS